MKLISLLMILSAHACYSQAILASNNTFVFYHDINTALNNNNPKEAIHVFSQLINFYKSTGQIKELPESYFGMALALAFNGDYNESIRFHKKAIKAHRKVNKNESIEMNINLGLTYHLAGKDRKARRLLGDHHFRRS